MLVQLGRPEGKYVEERITGAKTRAEKKKRRKKRDASMGGRCIMSKGGGREVRRTTQQKLLINIGSTKRGSDRLEPKRGVWRGSQGIRMNIKSRVVMLASVVRQVGSVIARGVDQEKIRVPS